MSAYFRTTTKTGGIPQPGAVESGEREVDGKHYVVLANTNGILAVYRIKPDGLLRRLKRWPRALTE